MLVLRVKCSCDRALRAIVQMSKRRYQSSSRSPSPEYGKIAEGCLAINKPAGITSAQVLRDMQRHFNPSSLFAPWLERERAHRDRENSHQRGRRRRSKQQIQVKIGHGGTLDPLATGVLITGIGAGTKNLKDFLDCTKTYECVVLFGVATDTYDCTGKVVGRKEFAHVTEAKVKEALGKFRGKIMQRPPIFSALHVQGKRLYEYAREGLEVPIEIAKRPVEVEQLELIEWLDSGSHQYQWPKEEAGANEKAIAEKVFDQAIINPGVTKPEDSAESPPVRKTRSESPVTSKAGVSVDEQTRTDEDEPVMSGALQTNAHVERTSPDLKESSEDSSKPPAARLRMTVTSGFYVRSLCQDLGIEVDSLALMSELVRVRQADFKLGNNVLEYRDLEKGEDVWGPQVEKLLEEWNA